MQHDPPQPVEVAGTRYYSVAQVAELLGISRSSLWRWRRDELVPQGQKHRRTGKVLFTREEFDQIRAYAEQLEEPQLVGRKADTGES